MTIPKTALLIAPPQGDVFHTPCGTLPALTAALVSRGHKVIQRDLNLELILDIVSNPDFCQTVYRVLHDRVNCRSPGWYDVRKPKDHPPITYLIAHRYFMSQRDGIRQRIDREAKGGVFSYQTDIETNRFYGIIFEIIHFLARELEGVRDCFDQIDNENNLLYGVYDRFFMSSVPWPEIGLVAITVAGDTQIIPALVLSRMIRKRFPHIHITLGGNFFTTYVNFDETEDLKDAHRVLRDYAHSIIVHEGETPLATLMDRVVAGKPWGEISNLVSLAGDGSVKVNRPYTVEDVNTLPNYDFEGLPLSYYPGLPVEISRGCYWAKCSFCRLNEPCAKQGHFLTNEHYRVYPIEKIISSIRFLQTRYHKDEFEFICQVVSPAEMEKISRAIIDAGIKIAWVARVRLDKGLTPELLQLMAQAGCRHYAMSPETFSPKTMRLLRKGYDIEHMKELIAYLNHHPELPPYGMGVFTTFPGETFEEFKKTWDFFITCKNRHMIHFYYLIKNSPVYDHPEQYGVRIEKKRNPWEPFKHYRLVLEGNMLEEKERIVRFLDEHRVEHLENIMAKQKKRIALGGRVRQTLSKVSAVIFIGLTEPAFWVYLGSKAGSFESLKKLARRFREGA